MRTGGSAERRAKPDGQCASDRTAAPVVNVVENYPEHEDDRIGRPLGVRYDGRSTDVEIVSSKKLLDDLRTGMRNLRGLWPKPPDFDHRVVVQASKIRSVEAKLFRLRQGRLL